MFKPINRFIDFLNRKNVILFMGITLTILIIIVAIFAPYIEPYNPTKMELSQKFIAPCSKYILGTDHLGRDILSRIIEGSRVSLLTAVFVVGISVFIGLTLGLISGYFGGAVDMVLMRIVDVLLAFPTIIFALALSTMIGTGQINLIIAICCIQWTRYARVTRGEAVMLKNAEYIDAAKTIGNSNLSIILNYVFPNVISKIIILASLDMGTIILYCASLSFLGLGAQPPSPEWGVMINEGKDYIQYAPWIAVSPGIAIAVCALAFNMLGDGLRDMLDPRMKETVRTE
ncbi:MAG: ABC transporter permease [Clostridia bacterium]|jgi:peptide/nickel transport system permease protein|nr:ABC transporter permease [Clostridia bacterium]MCI1999754.1 ABC transporter permease [Clostridia bacterium]MCI2014330.1 ABC transporter permease [Clostridia bacterium]